MKQVVMESLERCLYSPALLADGRAVEWTISSA